MKHIKYLILSLSLIAGFGLALLPVNASAASVIDNACTVDPSSVLCQKKNDSLFDYIKVITNTLLYVLGAISVVMIIIGGIRYTVSMGDAKSVESAKNTIMYSVVGLVVALLAYAIVNFVLNTLIK